MSSTAKTLWQVISSVESSNDPRAIRFEASDFASAPGWIANQVPAIQAAHPRFSQETCLMIACSSWGQFQMLGANIYALGYKGQIADFMQYTQGNAYCPAQMALFSGMITPHGFNPNETMGGWNIERYNAFAALWNGAGFPPAYVAAMQAAANA